MKIADTDILIVPGLGNSGPAHWQRRWAERFSTGRVVEQAEWDRPDFKDWLRTLQHEVMMATRPVVLIGHSLGVLAIAHAAQGFKDTKVRGALLVAVPDPEGENFPAEARDFARVPTDPLPFPSLLVASSNDPLCTVTRAVDFATAWGSDFHVANDAGHINVASGHGPWPEGLMMFTRLMQRI